MCTSDMWFTKCILRILRAPVNMLNAFLPCWYLEKQIWTKTISIRLFFYLHLDWFIAAVWYQWNSVKPALYSSYCMPGNLCVCAFICIFMQKQCTTLQTSGQKAPQATFKIDSFAYLHRLSGDKLQVHITFYDDCRPQSPCCIQWAYLNHTCWY